MQRIFLKQIVTGAALWACVAMTALAADVTMVFGEKIPPFCFPETNSGIEIEVIGEALAYRGHVLKPSYVPLARIPHEFKNGVIAAAMTDLGEDMQPHGGYYGDTAVTYDNVFITLKERKLSIKTPADLEGLSVLSFQGAVKRYPAWLAGPARAGKYSEQYNQSLQVLTLDRGRYDVVLSDRNIFKYHALELEKQQGITLKPVQEHSFVAVNPLDYRPVFRDKKIRDDFNVGLKHLKDTGRFQAIYDRYLKK